MNQPKPPPAGQDRYWKPLDNYSTLPEKYAVIWIYKQGVTGSILPSPTTIHD
jgi:hypothetical protein